MTDDEIQKLMIQFTRNYPEWVNKGIGNYLVEMNKHLDKIEKNTKKYEDKQKDKTKSLTDNQSKQIKSTIEVTKITQEQLKILRETVSNMRSYDKSLEKSTDKIEDETEAREDNTDAIEDNTKKFEGLTKGFGVLNRHMRDMTLSMKSIPDLMQSRQYGRALDNLTDSVSEVFSEFGKLGKGIGAVTLAAGHYGAALLDQLGKMQSTFSTFNQAGLSIPGGMFEIERLASRARMSMDDLSKLVGSGGEAIVRMGSEGVSSMSQLNLQLRDTTSIFRRMGMVAEEITEFQAETLKYESSIGRFKRLGAEQQEALMSTTLLRLTGLTSIMGRSISEIRAYSQDMLRKPLNQALLMQATTGMDKDNRQRVITDFGRISEVIGSLDKIPEQMRDNLSLLALSEIASREGRQLISPELAEVQAVLGTFTPSVMQIIEGLDAAQKEMTEIEAQYAESIKKRNYYRETGDETLIAQAEIELKNLAESYASVQMRANQQAVEISSDLYQQLQDSGIAQIAAVSDGPLKEYFQSFIGFAQEMQSMESKSLRTLEDLFTIEEDGAAANRMLGQLEEVTKESSAALSTFNMKILELFDDKGGFTKLNNGLSSLSDSISRTTDAMDAERGGRGAMDGVGRAVTEVLGAVGIDVSPEARTQRHQERESNLLQQNYNWQEGTSLEEEDVNRRIYLLGRRGIYQEELDYMFNQGDTSSPHYNRLIDWIKNIDDELLTIPQMATGGVALGSILANIGEAGPEMVLPLDPAMSDLAAHIAEKYLEIVMPSHRLLQKNLIRDLFRDNRDVVDGIFTKSLDKFFFSKSDVLKSAIAMVTDSESDVDSERRELMRMMGIDIAGVKKDQLSASSQQRIFQQNEENNRIARKRAERERKHLSDDQKEIFSRLDAGERISGESVSFLDSVSREDLQKLGIGREEGPHGNIYSTISPEFSESDLVEAAMTVTTERERELMDLVSEREGTAGISPYDVMLGDRAGVPGTSHLGTPPKPISEMTLSELKDWQKKMLRHPANKHNSSAAGRYQFVHDTLFGTSRGKGRLSMMGISPDDYDSILFDDKLQDKLFLDYFGSSVGDPNADPNTWNHRMFGLKWQPFEKSPMSRAEKDRIRGASPDVYAEGEITDEVLESVRERLIEEENRRREKLRAEQFGATRQSEPQIPTQENVAEKATEKSGGDISGDYMFIGSGSSGKGHMFRNNETGNVRYLTLGDDFDVDSNIGKSFPSKILDEMEGKSPSDIILKDELKNIDETLNTLGKTKNDESIKLLAKLIDKMDVFISKSEHTISKLESINSSVKASGSTIV